MHRAPPLIIGGGPAGAAAAIVLARSGRDVTLIERNAEPVDKVCGDFISAEAVSALTELGVDLACAASVRFVRLVHANRVATARLPFTALGLSRRTLDEALLRQAHICGATLVRGFAVREIASRGEGLYVNCDGIGPIDADTVFLATGKHDVRGLRRAAHSSGLVGLKIYLTLDPDQARELRGHVELVLFNGGYAGLQLVEAERAVLCLLVPASRLRSVGGRWDGLFDWLLGQCPHLVARLRNAHKLRARPLAVAGLPYGYLHEPRRGEHPRLFRLGDQSAVIPSLTGDGVALALNSGMAAARSWLQGSTASRHHRQHATLLRGQMMIATLFHGLCLNAATQAGVLAVCRTFPALLGLAATWTRTGTITA